MILSVSRDEVSTVAYVVLVPALPQQSFISKRTLRMRLLRKNAEAVLQQLLSRELSARCNVWNKVR